MQIFHFKYYPITKIYFSVQILSYYEPKNKFFISSFLVEILGVVLFYVLVEILGVVLFYVLVEILGVVCE
jgi:hypothetical protein